MDEHIEDIYESDRLMDRHDFVESEITGDVDEIDEDLAEISEE